MKTGPIASSVRLAEELKSPPDPFGAFMRLKRYPYAFFLDSSLAGGRLGQHSFVGCDPFLVFRFKDGFVSLEWANGREESFRADPFEALKEILGRFRADPSGPEVPFASGAVGYLSYDLKDHIEDLPKGPPDDIGIPDMMFGLYASSVSYDSLTGKCRISASGFGPDADGLARSRLSELKGRLRGAPVEGGCSGMPAVDGLESNYSRLEYMKMVRLAKEYIRKGDIYQVNLSQRFSARLGSAPEDLYRRLRELSPAPFASYLDFGDAQILSSSPERFLRKSGDGIETRPIKGTRPRGSDSRSDEAMEKELAASAKDMAEHVMIVDLERNDLGRVSRYGTVAPVESAVVEKYANVFHLVSTVSGTVRPGVDAVDCLRAAFPGGSITGAPKIRAMEIIGELENVRRSVYTGAIGYIGFDGNMDTSIVIRTFVIKGGRVYFQVGGGIVADSDPEAEYRETLDKAEGLMRALGVGRHEQSMDKQPAMR